DTPPSTTTNLPSSPVDPIPTSTSAENFSYVAKFPAGNMVDARFLDEQNPPPQKLVARMKFAFDDVTSCMLAIRENDIMVHALSFHHLGMPSSNPRQAMAQMLMATQGVMFDDAHPITLHIQSFDALSSFHDLPIIPTPCSVGSPEQCIDIVLANERPGLLDVKDPCND